MANYTDEQIKKALNRIIKDNEPKVSNGVDNCICCLNINLAKAMRDLINRQEAEKAELQHKIANCNAKIERLQRILNSYALQYGTAVDKDRLLKQAKSEAIKEFAEKIDELLKRYSHLHELAEKVRHSTEEYEDGTPIEMVSVREVLSLKKNEMVDYETMNDLQDNIEVIAKAEVDNG